MLIEFDKIVATLFLTVVTLQGINLKVTFKDPNLSSHGTAAGSSANPKASRRDIIQCHNIIIFYNKVSTLLAITNIS